MNDGRSLESADQRLTRRLGLALLLAVIVAPMTWSLIYSVLYSIGACGLFSDGWTVRHWRSALWTGGLTQSVLLSLSVALTVTALATAVALALSLCASSTRTVRHLAILLCLPLATPAAVAGLLAYQVLNPGGLIGRLAFEAGWVASPTEFPPLVNDRWALGIILTQFVTSVPLLTLYFLGVRATAGIDRYCRLAESLGATPMQARLGVALPMLLRRGGPLIMLVGLWQFGSFEVPMVLGRQSPQMFSVLTQRQFGQFDLEQRPEAFALAVTYLLLTGAGLMLFVRGRGRRAAGN